LRESSKVTRDSTERESPADAVERLMGDLRERIKELNCLYGISKLVETSGISLDQILQGTADLLPPAWRYPETACARIVLEDQEFKTENFRETPWRQVCDIKLRGERIGSVEACYLEERPESDEGPFSKEERSLINAVAERLGRTVQRKRTEEALRERLEVLLDTSPVGVLVADAGSGQVSLANQEARRIFSLPRQREDRLQSYEQAAVCRRPDGEAYADEELPLQRALRRGERVSAEEVVLEFPDGRTVPTLVSATPIYSARGKIMSAIAMVQDTTPLEEAEKLRSEFLGMVSHELKTPLTAIKGAAATALGSPTPLGEHETRELFQIIDEQGDRLRDLVNNLLDMTRIEAGRLSVSPGPTDLRAILDEARANFVRGGGSQALKIKLSDDLPSVNADSGRIVQVVGNLLANAARFSPPTAPIVIEVEHDSVSATVHVRDQGRGIAKEKLHHLFKKFARLHEDEGEKLSGSGLGLAICKGIVEAHGGRIWAESAGEGQGATFSFTLPIASEASVTSLSDAARSAVHLRKVARRGARTRVLAVDDEPQVLRYFQRSLNAAGYEAIVTSDPSQVGRLVELEEPDLILLDLIIPGTSGFDLLRHIREFSNAPVIIVTASEREEDTVRALKMGADDYVTKPFSPTELFARMEAALRRRVSPELLEERPPLALGDLRINFAERRVTVGGQPISLSATEYKLLYELATHAGRVLTHDQLLQRVWGSDYQEETGLLRSFVVLLRRKLGDDARHPRFIFTEPGVGYRMSRPQD
jgi:PAS domain S-box-containing protein